MGCVGLGDPLLGPHLPARVERGERGAQVVEPGEHGEGLLGAARSGVRQRIARGPGAGEGVEGGRDDLGEDRAGRRVGVEACEPRGGTAQHVDRCRTLDRRRTAGCHRPVGRRRTAGGPRRAGRRGRRAGEGSVPTGAVPVVLRCCVIHSPILRGCHFRNQVRGESVDELVSPHGNVDRIVEEVAVWRNGGCGGGDVDEVTLLVIRVRRTWLSVDGTALMGPLEMARHRVFRPIAEPGRRWPCQYLNRNCAQPSTVEE